MDDLSPEVIDLISKHLKRRDLSSLGSASRYMYQATRPEAERYREEDLVFGPFTSDFDYPPVFDKFFPEDILPFVITRNQKFKINVKGMVNNKCMIIDKICVPRFNGPFNANIILDSTILTSIGTFENDRLVGIYEFWEVYTFAQNDIIVYIYLDIDRNYYFEYKKDNPYGSIITYGVFKDNLVSYLVEKKDPKIYLQQVDFNNPFNFGSREPFMYIRYIDGKRHELMYSHHGWSVTIRTPGESEVEYFSVFDVIPKKFQYRR